MGVNGLESKSIGPVTKTAAEKKKKEKRKLNYLHFFVYKKRQYVIYGAINSAIVLHSIALFMAIWQIFKLFHGANYKYVLNYFLS